MKLHKYKLPEWDGESIKAQLSYNDIDVLLLDIGLTDYPSKEGRQNLIGCNSNKDIIWIAGLPKGQVMFGFYSWIQPRDETIFHAWCGSFFCGIEVLTGKIIWEQFTR